MNSIDKLENKRVLFLQGPMASFFKRLDIQMRKQGATTYKIALNAGDWFYSNKDNVVAFTGKTEQWGRYIHTFYKRYKIDYLFVFGDCRYYQRVAISVAKELNIKVFVFEEGYVRPDYITLECYGVNDFSKLPRTRAFYDALPFCEPNRKRLATRNSYLKMTLSAMSYYAIAKMFVVFFPHYVHHRGFSVFQEMFYGFRSVYRKFSYTLKDRKFNTILATTLSKKFYFVPLQVSSDFQVREHSDFKSIYDFIELVLHSFAQEAPEETFLVIKHHPMDRGRTLYSGFITQIAQKLAISERVIIVHEVHLPTILKNTIATVTINSTVGLSSLFHGIPTLVKGRAIYDIDGLTCKGMKLNDFWTKYHKPDPILFNKFRTYIIDNTQVNSSFYGDLVELEFLNTSSH